MLTKILILSCMNAFIMKVLSKKGLFYKPAKSTKEVVLSFLWDRVPDKVLQFTKCVPCRMTILLGLPEVIAISAFYGYNHWQILAVFVIGVLSTLCFTIIHPNYEEN